MTLSKLFPTFSALFRKEALPFWIVCVLLLALMCDRRLIVRKYRLQTEDTTGVRIALVTDLHDSRYGRDQRKLLDAIRAQQPDLILIGGDLFSDVDTHENTEAFLSGISGEYPCYYVTGNHEHWHGFESFQIRMDILEKYGIPVLDGTFEEVAINGTALNICGVSDPLAHMSQGDEPTVPFDRQLEAVAGAASNGSYTILLSHRPELFEQYAQYDFDLVLCGHAHGGQWRIPFLLNGLYAPQQGLFPEYAGGEYSANGTTMIVSRGLQRGKNIVPRIFNRPELVIIDLE